MNPPSQFVSLYHWISAIALYRRTFVHHPEHYKHLFQISQFPKFSTTKSLFCDHEWRRSSFTPWESCDHEHVENIRDIPDPSWLPPSCCKICEIVHFQSRNISASLNCDCQSLHLCAPTLSLARSHTVFVSNVSCLSFIREQMDWISLVSSSCFYQL